MDDDVTRAASSAFGPDRRVTWLAAGATVLAALALIVTADPAGRLLAVIAVVVLIAYIGSDLLFSPHLLVSARGLIINTPLTRVQLAWADVETVHAEHRNRFGLRGTTLEIDAGVTLVVLSRRALGADPEQVADLVNAFRPH